MKKINNNIIILIFLIINLLIFINSYYFSFTKPLWYDEIHVAFIASNIFEFSLDQYFQENGFQFPLYIYLTGVADLFIENDPKFLRILNLIGIIPFYYALKILKQNFSFINLYLLSFLTISSYVFFFFITDIKMYFIIFNLSFLIHAIYLIDYDQRSKRLNFFYYLSCLIAASFHISSLAIVLCILFCESIIFFKNKKFYPIIINFILCLIILSFVSFILFKTTATNDQGFGDISFVKFQKWYFRAFMEWIFPSLLFNFLLLIIVFIKFGIKETFLYPPSHILKYKKFQLIAPSIIMVIIFCIISFKIPIITHRNFIVTFPPIILCATILYYFLEREKIKILPIILMLCLASTFINFKYYRNNSMYSGENIEWVIKNSFTKKCENIPIYLNDNIYKSHWDRYLKHSLALYSKYNRPILKLSNFNNTELITVIDNKNECKVIAATFHERDLESKLMKTFNNFINYEIILAPNVLEQNSKSGAIVKFVTKK